MREYVPGLLDTDRRHFPAPLADQAQALRATRRARAGPARLYGRVLEARWQAPERYLDPLVRRGARAARHQDLLERDELDLGYRLLVSE